MGCLLLLSSPASKWIRGRVWVRVTSCEGRCRAPTVLCAQPVYAASAVCFCRVPVPALPVAFSAQERQVSGAVQVESVLYRLVVGAYERTHFQGVHGGFHGLLS